MLIDTVALVGRLSCQARSCWQASSITHWPSGTMRPVSSARGMNASGERRPRCGWSQRTSASTPVMRPVWSDTMGW